MPFTIMCAGMAIYYRKYHFYYIFGGFSKQPDVSSTSAFSVNYLINSCMRLHSNGPRDTKEEMNDGKKVNSTLFVWIGFFSGYAASANVYLWAKQQFHIHQWVHFQPSRYVVLTSESFMGTCWCAGSIFGKAKLKILT